MKDDQQFSLPQDTGPRREISSLLLLIGLILCGCLSLWLYHWARDLHRFIQGISGYTALFIVQFAIYLLATFFAMRMRKLQMRIWPAVIVILLFAAAFRFDLVAQRPYLSTDVYRYVWDGRVQAAGINPYRYVPSAPELAALRDEQIYPNINRKDYDGTPYPPGAQMIFLGSYIITQSSVTAFKSLLSIFDLISIIAVMIVLFRVGLHPAQAIVLAWHPLLIYEGAHSGHIESGFIVFLSLALLAWQYKAPTLTGAALAMATLIKYYPALLLPAFLIALGATANGEDQSLRAQLKRSLRPENLKSVFNSFNIRLVIGFAVTAALAHLPYLVLGESASGSLANEMTEEGFTGSGRRYFLIVLLRQVMPIGTNLFLGVAALVVLGMCIWWLLQKKQSAIDVAGMAVALIGLYFFLITPRYPWYYAWILPFLSFAPRLSWVYLTGASVLLYALWFTPMVYPEISVWMGLAVFAPTLGFLLLEFRQQKQPAFSTPDSLAPHSPVPSTH